jgi:hypothetical protein
MVAGVAISLLIVAWPGHAFGGVTASGVPLDPTGGSLSSGMVYVVRAGDTVPSIARLVNSSQPRGIEQAIVRELGTSVLLPGEHVTIP